MTLLSEAYERVIALVSAYQEGRIDPHELVDVYLLLQREGAELARQGGDPTPDVRARALSILRRMARDLVDGVETTEARADAG